MERGNYILFEGPEGAGKSTQIGLLHDYLTNRNIQVIKTREPGGTPFADDMRNIVKNSTHSFGPVEEMFLFSAARANLFSQVIIPALDSGIWVLSDRGFYSTEVYQGYAGKADLDAIQKLNKIAMQGIRPDLTFILDIPTEIGLSKEIEGGRMTEKGLEFHKKVREGYLEIAKNNAKNCVLIRYQEGHPEKISQEVIKNVERHFLTKKL